MVTIPGPQNIRSVGIARDPGTRANAGSFGALEAQVAEQGARQVQQIGAQFQQIALTWKAQDDEAAAKDADVKLNGALRSILFDPEKGFYTRKGKNAVDGYAETMKQVQALQEEYGKDLSPSQRRLFESSASRRIEGTLTDLTRHVGQERRVWLDTASEARIIDAMSDGAANFQSEGRISQSLVAVRNEIMGQAERNGWAPELTNVKLEKAESDLHKQVIGNRLVRDPLGAQAYFEKVRGRIVGGDLDGIEQALKHATVKATAESLISNIANGGAVDGDALFTAVKQVESGNRERNPDGSLVTSSKGAQGAAQVMPDTARNPGFGVTPAKDDSDAERTRVGRDYLQALLARYGGNRTLALAAYNAGPGKVDEWLGSVGDPRKGQMSDAEWAAKLPYQETREYVEKVQRRASTIAADRPSLSAWLDQAKGIEDPDVRAKVESGLVTEFNRHEAREREAARTARDEVWKLVIDPSVSTITQIPNEKWAALPGETQRSVLAYLEKKATGRPIKTDLAVYSDLRREILAGKEVDVLHHAASLSESDAQELIRLQTPDKRNDAERSAARTRNEIVDSALRDILKIDGGAKASDKERERRAMFERRVDDDVRELERETGKKATSEQVQKIVDGLLLKVAVPGILYGTNDKFLVDVTPDDVPKAERAKIAEALTRAGRPVTDDAVVALYIRKQAK